MEPTAPPQGDERRELTARLTLEDYPRSAAYDPRFSSDRFGVAVHCPPDRSASVRQILQAAGAEEIKAVA